MKTVILGVGMLSLCANLLHTQALAQNPVAPTLSIRPLPNQAVRLTWTNAATGFVVEAASLLGDATLWRPIPQTPILEGNQFAVAVDASVPSTFFRLQLPPFATVQETSPVNGETGVAVIRETIVHFSLPLSANAVVGANNFYAGYGGRRLLARVELSSDRMKATLFYLEPLPGSTRVSAVFDGTGLTDVLGRPLDADADGQPGGSAVIAFDTLSLTPLAGTAVVGRVFASELMPGADTGTNAVNRPLEGVTITVDGREQELRTRTDAMGNFTLTPVPPGRFFVKIDGRTAKGSVYPGGAYYPYVGKAWDAVAGRTNNLAGGTGDIFLPLITVGTLQPVSMTQDTFVEFPAAVIASNPALAGVSITVPANSLFSDDGTRGGKVGVAPVPPDRLPGPLPPGLELAIVITVQTDGPLNFDKPAPVCFPNLPDPVLGTPLAPGSKQALISFNHKKGIWEAVGSMTVSADGKFVCTDPGVGILQPGWNSVGPTPDDPDPCKDACCGGSGGGGGGPEAASLASRRPISLHGPVCKKPCNGKAGFKECLGNCQEARDDKIKKFVEAQATLEEKCKATTTAKGPKHKDSKECWTMYNTGGLDKRAKILREFILCSGGCKTCQDAGEPASFSLNVRRALQAAAIRPLTLSALAAQPTSATDQILALYDQIFNLISSAFSAEEGVAESVLAQADALEAQADAIAGGDATLYLRNLIIRAEEESFLVPSITPQKLGNAPPYPIPYAATILRKGEFFYLRAETGPFGNYSLFVPRDGELLDVSFYDPRTKEYGFVFARKSPNAPNRLPRFTLLPLDGTEIDSDRDGLADIVELVYGTASDKQDTDGDGIPDGAEVENGANPLDGLPTQTGIIATAKTPGPAVDVCVANDLVILAELNKGVSVFNIFNGMNPTLIAHVDTAGSALRVACSGTLIAVADGPAGLAVIDISDPSKAHVVYQLSLGSGAVAVTTEGRIVHVLTQAGQVVSVDMATGVILSQANLPLTTGTMADLVATGDYLYALTTGGLHVLSKSGGNWQLAASVSSTSSGGFHFYQRLFVGGGFAYAGRLYGYDTFSLVDPALPIQINTGASLQLYWLHIVANGSGLGLAAVDGEVSLYDLHDPTTNELFLTSFPTPGIAYAVSIFNGLAYVADASAGLQVINYLAYDSKGVPPTLSLSASFPLNLGQVESGARLRVTANAADDVQVREVELYLDGARFEADGNFPFEFYFAAPALAPGKTSFKVRARAIDTGGSATWSDELTVSLLPDTTPPAVAFITPRKLAGAVNSVSALFDELTDPASLTPAALQLFAAGPDGLVGTADDVLVTGGNLSLALQNGVSAMVLTFNLNLPLGTYRVVVGRDIADHAGNHLASVVTGDFRVVQGIFWINPGGGDWSDPRNWSGGRVPGPNDNVVIALPIPALVTHSQGADSIASLITGSPFLLSGGTLEITETLQVNGAFELNGGTLASARVLPGDTDSALRLKAGTLDGVTLDTDLTLENDQVGVKNGLTINKTVGLSSSGFYFIGPQTLGGTGQIVFSGAGVNNYLFPDSTLTIGAGFTIHGASGSVGNRNIPLVNAGTIVADVAGQTVLVRGQPFNNSGKVEAKNSAILVLDGEWNNTGTFRFTDSTANLGGSFTTAGIGNVQPTGGAINITGLLNNTNAIFALNASLGSWTLAGGTIRGGSISSSGGASLRLKSGTLDGVTLDTDLTLEDFDQVGVRNDLTINKTVTLASKLASTIFSFQGPQTLGGPGQIVFAGASGNNHLLPDSTLTIAAGFTIQGASGTIGNRNVPLINEGTIVAEVAGQTILIRGQPFNNRGTVEVKNGAILSLDADWNNTGTIRFTDSTINLGGSFTTAAIGNVQRSGGALNITGLLNNTNAIFALNANTGSWNLQGTIRGGNITTSGGATLVARGTLDGVTLDADLTLADSPLVNALVNVVNGLTLNGTLTVASLSRPAGLTFTGTQTLGGNGQVVFAGTGGNNFLVPTSGTLTIGPALTIRGGTGAIGDRSLPLINEGTVSADVAGGIITIRGNPFTNNGTTQELNGGKLLINP